MTYTEAKAFFEECLWDGKCNEDCPECNAMELAISALEKQIPKKPDLDDGVYCPCMKISQSAVARLFGARFIHCLAAMARCSERTVHIQGAMHPYLLK